MATVTRNVHFHLLNVYDKDEKNRKFYTAKALHKLFLASASRKSHQYEEEGYEIISKKLTEDVDEVMLDVIECSKAHAFCRLARKKDINTIQKRNSSSYAPIKITLDPDERLEVYSYFLIDFENGLVTNLYYRSAPSIHNIENLFLNLNSAGKLLESSLIQVPNDNAISMINRMSYFGKLEMKFAIPAEDFFTRMGVPLTPKEFKSLAKLKSKNISIIVGGGDDKLSEDDYKDIKKCITDLVPYHRTTNEAGSYSGILTKMKFDGRIRDSQAKSVNLLDEYFVEQVSLEYEETRTYIPIKVISKSLKQIYNEKKNELLERVETSTLIG